MAPWSRVVSLLWIASASVISAQQRLDLYEGEVCKADRGDIRLCTKLNNCQKAQEDLQNSRKVDFCNFEGSTVIVCCDPRPSSSAFQQQTPTTPSPASSKSLQMCRKYAESVFYTVTVPSGESYSVDTCVNVETLIINGTVAQPREFPHMAVIGMETRRGILWRCGGSLISERFVLSAAHCNPQNPKKVRLGDYNILSTQDDDDNVAKSVEYDIVEITAHPEYDDVKNYNDITLYRLDRDVVFNEYIRPICLHSDYQLNPGFGIISGWGSTEYAGKQSDILVKGNVMYVPAQECGVALNPSLQNSASEVRDDMMICAGNFVNGTDSCQGDSGGPLQYRLNDPYCMYSQVGITSFGVRCGSNFPAVYTRVSNYISWIESIVWP